MIGGDRSPQPRNSVGVSSKQLNSFSEITSSASLTATAISTAPEVNDYEDDITGLSVAGVSQNFKVKF